MSTSGDSPWQQILRRFRKNKAAMAGWYAIILSFLLALFTYLIVPDQTPLSNRMSLPLSNQSPGFSVSMIKLPMKSTEESNLLEWTLFGKEDPYEWIPVSAYRLADSGIYYREYAGDADLSVIPEKFIDFGAFNGNGSGEEIKEYIVSRTFLFGTDRFGRDMLSRLITGTRVTLGVGLLAVIISLFIGIVLGSVAGFFRGWIDSAIVWLINVVWSIPTLLLVIAITLVLGKGFEQVFIAVGLTMWVDVARIVRGQLFSIRELEFVSAGRAMGFGNLRIIGRHMLPNIMGPVLVIAAANFSTAILLEAGLSFLGIGAQPPTPSWGAMIKENYGYIIIPGRAYLAILPGLAIMLLTVAFTFVANGLRDAMDARAQVTLV